MIVLALSSLNFFRVATERNCRKYSKLCCCVSTLKSLLILASRAVGSGACPVSGNRRSIDFSMIIIINTLNYSVKPSVPKTTRGRHGFHLRHVVPGSTVVVKRTRGKTEGRILADKKPRPRKNKGCSVVIVYRALYTVEPFRARRFNQNPIPRR